MTFAYFILPAWMDRLILIALVAIGAYNFGRFAYTWAVNRRRARRETQELMAQVKTAVDYAYGIHKKVVASLTADERAELLRELVSGAKTLASTENAPKPETPAPAPAA